MTWHLEDSRTHRRVSIMSYPSKESADRQIQGYRDRDAKGGRPDIHDLIPYIVAVEGS